MKLKSFSNLLTVVLLVVLGLSFSSCSTSQSFYFAKGTGAFKDPYKTNSPTANTLTANATSDQSATDLTTLLQAQVTAVTAENSTQHVTQKIIIQKPSRKELKNLKIRLEAVLDTTKKRERVTIKTNEKKVDELRNEVESLKNSVRTEKQSDKVVVSFDKPQTSLSKEAKILIIVGAALLLIGLLSLPIIGPVLGVVLGIAVVAAALALVLGIVEIG
ncbi:hypothetical protein [Adhaeribacter pallidiroseus]|uniref:Uncharacterized protein n=1 Tax=Adhaeribacter pallidiroseus TaxID=2072847 RepID=A0A369QL59_9BACT|nr:hypothetical protein [Adhaeribacter pallidiroseus]RDC65663.1 hypothetical protein AHMF7616_04293 [Adhaeribacter pallidiroseus]